MGFEPTGVSPPLVFKTSAFVRSAMPPSNLSSPGLYDVRAGLRSRVFSEGFCVPASACRVRRSAAMACRREGSPPTTGALGSFSTNNSPKVGYSGSSASKSQTGKSESIPPSTMRCSPPVLAFTNLAGSKKMGMLMLMRTTRATSRSSGIVDVELGRVPRQDQQAPLGEVRSYHLRLIAVFKLGVFAADQVPEASYPLVL